MTRAGTLQVSDLELAVSGLPASALIAIVDDTKRIDITSLYGQPPPDVVGSLKNLAARKSGFDEIISLLTR